MARAIFIQVETNAWFVINEVHSPRFLIRYVPAVHRQTGETHILYRVQRWQIQRVGRVHRWLARHVR